MTHDCGHMMYDFRTWLIVMSHGFRAGDPFRVHDLFYEFLIGFSTLRSWLIGVNWRILHYDSLWVMSRVTRSMSHTGLGLREGPTIKRDLGRLGVGYFSRSSELGFSLLNQPGVYTRFPLGGSGRPSVLDLSFASPLLLPFCQTWDTCHKRWLRKADFTLWCRLTHRISHDSR